MSASFSHQHLLGIQQLSKEEIQQILDLGAHYAKQNRSDQPSCDKLAGKTVVNLFFEDSTRTRTSFEIAAKRLGAHVVNFNASNSSMNKGETFGDTMRCINAMQVDGFVIRHKQDGAVQEAAAFVDGAVLNAGDGANEHPTQALLDALTITRHKGSIDGLNVAICGDLKHSRVAKSDAILLTKMGANVTFFAPPQFEVTDAKDLGVTVASSLEEAIKDADVVIMLRIQNERMADDVDKMPIDEYHVSYGLNHDKLKSAKSDVIVMHPSPVNRGVEITSALMDDPQYSVIIEQMEMGVAVRMACLDLLLS